MIFVILARRPIPPTTGTLRSATAMPTTTDTNAPEHPNHTDTHALLSQKERGQQQAGHHQRHAAQLRLCV